MPSILVVDDDADTAEALRLTLTYSGYLVQVAETTDGALAAFRRSRPDFILLDYILKGSLGASDFVSKVREENFQGKIILMSGISDPAQKAIQLGLQASIKKPFETDQLLKKFT